MIIRTQDVVNVIENTREDMRFDVGNFLEQFYYILNNEQRQEILDKEPKWTKEIHYEMAFISAMINKLAVDYDLNTPRCGYNEEYFMLKEPHFAMNAKGDLRLVLLVESPKQFRMRNIFTTENVLSRV